MRSRLIATAWGLCALLLGSVALAGQVRIDVSNAGGANLFFPPIASLNQGDQVGWVWLSGTHSVTSGASCTPTGLFDSGNIVYNATNGTAFTWKSTTLGSIPYYCIPHCLMGMTGTLEIAAAGNPVANFRITEVQYDLPNGRDLVEITNFGNASGDLGRYRLVSSTDNATVPVNSFVVPAGGRVIVHVNMSGAQAPPTDLYLPSLADLPAVGSLALFMPNTTASAGFDNATQIVDFVQWAGPGWPPEATAVAAGFWTAGHYLQPVAPGHSLEFCGGPSDRGAFSWAEVAVPNFGSNGSCSTPTLKTTWGRLKTIYR